MAGPRPIPINKKAEQMSFSKDFVWGAAAASYQIEGSTQGVDGCGESVWDLCCRKKTVS
jgi:beta-glucosidase/6-phospho-beta-glucosidase/beta-galactosidase